MSTYFSYDSSFQSFPSHGPLAAPPGDASTVATSANENSSDVAAFTVSRFHDVSWDISGTKMY